MVVFDRRTAGAIFVIQLRVMLGGTFASPVSLSKKAMVSVGLVVFGPSRSTSGYTTAITDRDIPL